jgi:hypothetical protein
MSVHGLDNKQQQRDSQLLRLLSIHLFWNLWLRLVENAPGFADVVLVRYPWRNIQYVNVCRDPDNI